MKKLSEIATSAEIETLLQGDIVKSKHVDEQPLESLGMGPNAHDIYFRDGVRVFFYKGEKPYACRW